MITAIVSAIGGPISSVVSGWLGGSGMWRMWPWNLVPTQVEMLGSDVPWALPGMQWYVRTSVFLYYSGMVCRCERPRPRPVFMRCWAKPT